VGPLILLASVTAVVTCDQVTKALVIHRTAAGHGDGCGRVGIRLLTNARGAPVPLPGAAAVTVWGAVAVGVILALALVPVVPLAALGLGLALGGAAGNLVDRIARDGVVDFLVVGRWPAFNLADAALVLGAALCAWSLV
jgi:signal peptidase II